MKRFCIFLLVLCLTTTLVVGCANDGEHVEEPTEGEAPVVEEKLKVALLLPGGIDDSGWNTSGYNGLKAIEEKLGAEVSYIERVPLSNMEEVYRNYGNSGYDLILAHGFEFGDAAMKVAEDFPETTLLVMGTQISQDPNLSSLIINNYELGFLEGITAAILSETGVIGAIGGVPIPPIVDTVDGYVAGAKYVRPDIEIITVMTGSFDDAASAKEQAAAIIDQGADVMMNIANNAGLGVIEAADEAGIYSIGSISVQFHLGKNVIACSVNDIPLAYTKIAEKVIDGSMDPEVYLMGAAEDVVDLVLNPDIEIDADKLAEINDIVDKVKSGEMMVLDLASK